MVSKMITLCDNMPYYLHLLATNSAKCALERGGQSVTETDLASGIEAAALDADQTLREVYDDAILSSHGSFIYRRIIWAMADAEEVSLTLSSITERANLIATMQGDDAVTPQAIGAALKNLISDKKSEILETRRHGLYRFRQPLMKGYVRLARAKQ